jgi:hypothetical protein
MKKVNWNNMLCVLVDEDGRELTVGSQIEDPRENKLLLIEGGSAPHKPSSSGRVVVSGFECFPHVYGLKWVETGEQAPDLKRVRVASFGGVPNGRMIILKGFKK